jgi:hypothetical protein
LLEKGRTVMVQRYVESVDVEGEVGLLYIDGRFSHAIHKAATLVRPGAAEGRVFAPERITAAEPEPGQLSAADAVLDALPWPRGDLLYARVDLVRGENGESRLLEVELTEPSLYLRCGDGAADRFAAAIARRLSAVYH